MIFLAYFEIMPIEILIVHIRAITGSAIFHNQPVSALAVRNGMQHGFEHIRQRVAGPCPKLFISVSDVFEKILTYFPGFHIPFSGKALFGIVRCLNLRIISPSVRPVDDMRIENQRAIQQNIHELNIFIGSYFHLIAAELDPVHFAARHAFSSDQSGTRADQSSDRYEQAHACTCHSQYINGSTHRASGNSACERQLQRLQSQKMPCFFAEKRLIQDRIGRKIVVEKYCVGTVFGFFYNVLFQWLRCG